jgi:hypothetical protein
MTCSIRKWNRMGDTLLSLCDKMKSVSSAYRLNCYYHSVGFTQGSPAVSSLTWLVPCECIGSYKIADWYGTIHYWVSFRHLSCSGQSSWLQMQRSEFDSRNYQIFWEVVGLERGPLNLVSTIEELLGRKRSGSGLEGRDYGRRDPSRWPHDTPSFRKSCH